MSTELNGFHSAFAYWDGDHRTNLSGFFDHWRKQFPEFKIYGNDEIRQLICRYFTEYAPEYQSLFDQIRIPAAKADIARLLLLYEFGGLYVDCHCGMRDPVETKRIVGRLLDFECIFIDRRLDQIPRLPDEHFLLNAVILSRPKSDLIWMIACQALANLACHRTFEKRVGRIPYHIGSLTGPALVTSMVLQPDSDNREIRADYKGRVLIVREEDAPVERNRLRNYGGPGQHWYERQSTELLFA